MISIKNILTVSAFESKVLWRNWFFRIVALIGLGAVTLLNLVEFSTLDDPAWRLFANSWIIPASTMFLIAIPQVAAIIFLGTGLIKKDKKLDTNEVFFVRPITNLDYVFGKALAIFKLFFLLNLVLLLIPLVVTITNPLATLNPTAYILMPLLTSVPSIVFTTGIAFLLVTLIKNQPISIVILLGATIVMLIYYFDKLSYIHDFMAFRLSILPSEMSGFLDIEFALWQRAFYFITGIAFLFITAFFIDRLASHRAIHLTTGIVGVIILCISSFIMVRLLNMRNEPIKLRQEMIAINDIWANQPNINIISNKLDIEWVGDEIVGSSQLVVKNFTDQHLEKIYFTLNPGLEINKVLVNNKPAEAERDLQILHISNGVNIPPGKEIKVDIQYRGHIMESAAHLEVDQERYESPRDYSVFSLKKKYAFLQPDYVLLTKDVLWYPDTQIGYSREAANKDRLTFTKFGLTVKAPVGKTAISQGQVTLKDNVHHFNPEYPLPQISLVIGDYAKKEITVDSITYAVYHHPKNTYFTEKLELLQDTLSYLIKDNVAEYEDAQKIKYPFNRLTLIETPLHFFAYDKIYESSQAYLQPESVLLPEQGADIPQFDFRRQLITMNKQAASNNQVLSEKQKQANLFNDLIKKVFTKQAGRTWTWDGSDSDEPDYSVYPNYYTFNSGVVSLDWAILNSSIANYLRNDKQIQNDYSRNINGISFTEECNNLMREASLTEILTEADFDKIKKSVTLKSQYLFSYLGQIIGERQFREFLFDWVNNHQHQLTSYEMFRKAVNDEFNLDIDTIIRKVYFETSQPAFEILDVQKYEVMDGDRKRYQVLFEIKNSGDNDGVIEVKYNTGKHPDDEDYYSAKVNEDVKEEAPGMLSVIKQGETKLLGIVMDEKPYDLSINTIISRNIPSVIMIPIGATTKRDGGELFEGERVITDEKTVDHYEVIVDNEDPGFSSFSPIEPTYLRAYLDNQNPSDKKYYGYWSRSYSKWLATTGSDLYGDVIRSAHFTRSGNGEKIATWTPEFKEEGFYDIYVFMKGKNQNEFLGNDGASRQYNYNYIINNADGTDNIKYNISNAEPGWNYLGSYYFTKTGGSVSLTDECDLSTVYADAIKWVKQ